MSRANSGVPAPEDVERDEAAAALQAHLASQPVAAPYGGFLGFFADAGARILPLDMSAGLSLTCTLKILQLRYTCLLPAVPVA